MLSALLGCSTVRSVHVPMSWKLNGACYSETGDTWCLTVLTLLGLQFLGSLWLVLQFLGSRLLILRFPRRLWLVFQPRLQRRRLSRNSDDRQRRVQTHG